MGIGAHTTLRINVLELAESIAVIDSHYEIRVNSRKMGWHGSSEDEERVFVHSQTTKCGNVTNT